MTNFRGAVTRMQKLDALSVGDSVVMTSPYTVLQGLLPKVFKVTRLQVCDNRRQQKFNVMRLA